ncbi:hypothetical protein RND81_03G072500 [Saponaria officinalis]|uniref:Basic blue protein n=1 Tax=Saponaria officinalis TaxID=3572 RepID=A0AAW1M5E2_SAPOF
MGQGSGSAKSRLVVWAAILGLWALARPAIGAVYYVGGSGGWTFNVRSWPEDKAFKAGDVLVFNYLNAWHNVVEVDKNGYDNCISPRDAKVYQSGRDEITLNKGHNYFICTALGHCQSGMKIHVLVD